MKLRKPSSILVLGLVLALAAAQPALAQDTANDVAEQLMCMCSCNMMLSASLRDRFWLQ